jgi:thiosulfate dehydrogenase [quinone] large subunit
LEDAAVQENPVGSESPCAGCSSSSDGARGITRRRFLAGISGAGALAIGGGIVGSIEGLGATVAAASTSKAIAKTSQVPLGHAFAFVHPSTNTPAYLVQTSKGKFAAYSRICTHMGCEVSFTAKSDEFACPCHGSLYNATTGAVIQGPAPKALPSYKLTVKNGEIYLAS